VEDAVAYKGGQLSSPPAAFHILLLRSDGVQGLGGQEVNLVNRLLVDVLRGVRRDSNVICCTRRRDKAIYGP
jgi:hypothetical protein